jgi:hypothetical protein
MGIECWLCVNKDGVEQIREEKPKRFFGTKEELDSVIICCNDSKKKNIWITDYDHIQIEDFPTLGKITMVVNLPKGTIEKILGYPLTWGDDAVKLS